MGGRRTNPLYADMRDPLYAVVRDAMNSKMLVPSGCGLIIGLSGGPDSICLAHILVKYFTEAHDGVAHDGSAAHDGVAHDSSAAHDGGMEYDGSAAHGGGMEYDSGTAHADCRIERLVALHVNHMLRGAESARDEEHSARFCDSAGIRLVRVHEDVAAYAAKRNISVEAAGHEVRYRELERERVALESSTGHAWRIAVAHNSDDLAETVLMNIIRGAGVGGLRGMRAEMDNVVRPLLGVSRRQIEAYLARNGIEPVLDSTNADMSYMRNRIRGELAPLLREKYNPRISGALLRLSESAAQDYDYLEHEAERAFNAALITAEPLRQPPQPPQPPGGTICAACEAGIERNSDDDVNGDADANGDDDINDDDDAIDNDNAIGDDDINDDDDAIDNDNAIGDDDAYGDAVTPAPPLPPHVTLSLNAVQDLHPAIASRVILLASSAARADVRSIGRVHVSDVLELVSKGRTGVTLHLPGGLRVRRSYGSLSFYVIARSTPAPRPDITHISDLTPSSGSPLRHSHMPEAVSPPQPASPAEHCDNNCGFVTKSSHKKDIHIIEEIGKISYNSYEQLFDADILAQKEFVLRTRQAGDCFYPLGSPGAKKLKDFFIDAKIPAELRDSISLLAIGAEIVWVIGYRISERYKVAESTRNVLRIRFWQPDGARPGRDGAMSGWDGAKP